MDLKNTSVTCVKCRTVVPWMQAFPGDKCRMCFEGEIQARIEQRDLEVLRQTAGRAAIDRALYSSKPRDFSRTRQAVAAS